MASLLESVGLSTPGAAAAYAARCLQHETWGIDAPDLAPALWQRCAQALIGERAVIVFYAEDGETDESGRPLRAGSFYKVSCLGLPVGVIDIGRNGRSTPARALEVLLHEAAHGKSHWHALPLLTGFEKPLSVVRQSVVHKVLTAAFHGGIEDEAEKLAAEWLAMAERLAPAGGIEAKLQALHRVYSAFRR